MQRRALCIAGGAKWKACAVDPPEPRLEAPPDLDGASCRMRDAAGRRVCSVAGPGRGIFLEEVAPTHLSQKKLDGRHEIPAELSEEINDVAGKAT